jgi:hypothetical protein
MTAPALADGVAVGQADDPSNAVIVDNDRDLSRSKKRI